MPRRKPASAKQRKAELQLKRAVKRGDLPPEAAAKATNSGRGRRTNRGRNLPPVDSKVESSRRLESSFVKLSPAILEEAKRKSSILTLTRPLPLETAIWFEPTEEIPASSTCNVPALSALKRPKWNYEMNKKMVENNEEGVFKKWIDETEKAIETWKSNEASPHRSSEVAVNKGPGEGLESTQELDKHADGLQYSPPLFERNLEVWRQLWRVTEICQVLLILLDSRCPTLHYPPSLNNYLETFRPPRKIVFVLTKVDISGPDRATLWSTYLASRYPSIPVVQVESYLEKRAGEGQGKRRTLEPHIPTEARQGLVDTLKAVHEELCTPPLSIANNQQKLATWQPGLKRTINWNAVLHAGDKDITHHVAPSESLKATFSDGNDGDDAVPDYLSVGLIGQPNVGKSSLLNALFGSHKVKASRTPGKTKHFQTLFWTDQIRLVDCPGLVFPNFVNMEMQVLAGILPISQIPAIPSCTYHALQCLPLENIFKLQHPAEKEKAVEDKRTWREGMRPAAQDDSGRCQTWTTMDVLTAFAEKQNWITAKAGRPDVNRAGNAILRSLAEGKIRWAFYPPDTNTSQLAKCDPGSGIWIKRDEDAVDDVIEDDLGESDADDLGSDVEGDEEDVAEDESDSDDSGGSRVAAGTGMFNALTLVDEDQSDGEGEGADE